ncbi:hypothetical protein EK21DRAFT_90168 [Setomelanomma holmii]|uniref:Protein kinase domain-containing protein n=1 Tax=Setomelanomma holmii TaxID=210430 RepID=A0A9P4LLS5_9PLEO|nr:hypothetical protein EK21DRAFT_90168 [Setomelanomma holmii]
MHGDHVLEKAFVRIPRPQRVLDPGRPLVPTKSALLQANQRRAEHFSTTPSPTSAQTVPSSSDSAKADIDCGVRNKAVTDDTIEIPDLNVLGPVITLGTLTQNNVKWILRAQRGRSGLVMVKRLVDTLGVSEKQVLEGLNHRNIVKIIHSFYEQDQLCLAIEYCRFTLAEILFVHLKLEEQQVQYIARSIFDALTYLGKHGIAHHGLNSQQIRVTPDLRIVVDCMEGRVLSGERRDHRLVQERRRSNKVFGLTFAERWSGAKQLIDFLDDIFITDRPIFSKFIKPQDDLLSTGLLRLIAVIMIA